MDFSSQYYLKKTLIDTQERVRDFMHYYQKMEDGHLKEFFRCYAESEANQAKALQGFIG